MDNVEEFTVPLLAVIVMCVVMLMFAINPTPLSPFDARFSEQSFKLGQMCDGPTQTTHDGAFAYSYGLLSVGAFREQQYPVHASSTARDDAICLEVTVPFKLENINEGLDEAVNETCSNAKNNMVAIYITTTTPKVLPPHKMRVIVVPVLDTGITVGNTRHVQSTQIPGTAHECK